MGVCQVPLLASPSLENLRESPGASLGDLSASSLDSSLSYREEDLSPHITPSHPGVLKYSWECGKT